MRSARVATPQLATRALSGGCLRRTVEVAHHGGVQLVASVLLVHLGSHTLEGFFYLGLGHHTVVQLVGHMLAANAQSGAVFHQADVVARIGNSTV